MPGCPPRPPTCAARPRPCWPRPADLSFVSGTAASHRIDAVGYQLGIGNFSDRTAAALQPLTGNPAQLVAVALNTPEYLVH